MKKLLFVLLIATIIVNIGCKKESSDLTYDSAWDTDRPMSPWVFRSVLDSMPRMITFALDDDLWAAYSAESGALYKVWKGVVNLDGAVYTNAHGPQPTTIGDSWMENDLPNPIMLLEDGKPINYDIQFKGHKYFDGRAALMYNLNFEGGTINVEESPERVENGSGQTGFERIFTVKNVPDGMTVIYKMMISSIALESNIETDGKLNIVEKETKEVKGVSGLNILAELELTPNASTSITTYFVKSPLIANAKKKQIEVEEIPLGAKLINKSDCRSCHNTYRQTVGPAYIEVAKRYDNTASNVTMLASKVIAGGSGAWGDAAMSAHPNLELDDAKAMVQWIMDLDKEEEGESTGGTTITEADYVPATDGLENTLPGVLAKIYEIDSRVSKLADLQRFSKPIYAGALASIDLRGNDFNPMTENFAMKINGYIDVPESGVYHFRLMSDDGSNLLIDGQEVINHDGFHGASPKDGTIGLQKGLHPFEVNFFQGLGGRALVLQWRTDDTEFISIPQTSLVHTRESREAIAGLSMPISKEGGIPGDASPLAEVHPSFEIAQARPNSFLPKVGGMDFLSDGRLVVSTWEPSGGIHIIENAASGDPSKMKVKTIAKGLAEPLGLKVVDDEIYVLQKQELTKLVDTDNDDYIDEYITVSNDWGVSSNFHEFAFGLVYKDGYFYGTLATGILPGGASANPQIPDRGKVAKISKETGEVELIASGLRTPNGIGIGIDGEIFVADNQGDWLPSSKIVHIRDGAWYGSRSVDFEGTANLKEALPVVWLPQDEIGNSPSTPLAINVGPYKGQMIHGEVTHGGVKRVFVEKVNDEYQGALFRFTQGLEAGVNRMIWGPDGSLYVGGIGNPGNWGHDGKLWYGLQKLTFNDKPTFEMLAVRAKSNGIEIEFTEPLQPQDGWNKEDYLVKQWYYQPTENYGGPKLGEQKLNIKSVNISEDRKKVFLELQGMKAGHVVYLRLMNPYVSENGNELWSTECWYTMNNIPQNQPGFTRTKEVSFAPNKLTEMEKEQGWKLLFDGETTNGWHNFNKETIGSSWKVVDGTLTLDVEMREDGHWQAKDGGDIISEGEYENYELTLEWKIQACGNSGIMYNVVETEEFDYPWQTGPEMQILDNACHPDAKFVTHRAGDLYDMIACKYVTVKPAGEWNQVRLVVNNGKTEHWLNGRKVVEFTMFTPEWNEMIANSKFKDMEGFGQARKGRIALQDHGDKVWFRNIKIREL